MTNPADLPVVYVILHGRIRKARGKKLLTVWHIYNEYTDREGVTIEISKHHRSVPICHNGYPLSSIPVVQESAEDAYRVALWQIDALAEGVNQFVRENLPANATQTPQDAPGCTEAAKG